LVGNNVATKATTTQMQIAKNCMFISGSPGVHLLPAC